MWLGHSVLAIAQRRHGCIDPWIRKIPCKRKWQPTPVFLTGKPHEQRAQMDYSPWGHKELDMTEHTHTPHPTHTHTQYDIFSNNHQEAYGGEEEKIIIFKSWKLHDMLRTSQ